MSRNKIGISACIDLGSSYFRLLLADIEEDTGGRKIKPLYQDSRYIGWGDEVENRGLISTDKMSVAAEYLREFVNLSIESGCDRPVIVGTNAFRKADNAHEVLSHLQENVSPPVYILSETGEAALGFRGASSVLGGGEKGLLIDIGGTSTEIAWGKDGLIDDYIEIPIGTHRVASFQRDASVQLEARFLRRNFFESISSFTFRSDYMDSRLSSLPAGLENFRILATGGTAVSSALVLRFIKRMPCVVENDSIIAEELFLMTRRIKSKRLRDMHRFLPVTLERARLLIPGLVLLNSIISHLGVNEISVTPRDLRWGVLISGGVFEERFLFNE
ncbi:MAG: hypothetical protein U5O15_06235 [Candidatus Krumholzibacteriota bacterium]|nr:hypothetical protein [Candidatus Krumholzibacteriota bacterium]